MRSKQKYLAKTASDIETREGLDNVRFPVKKLNNRIAIIFLSLLIIGCSATGPEFQRVAKVVETDALVYLYRPARFKGAAIVPPVFIDGIELFDLPNDGYAVLNLGPGKHSY